MARLSRARSRAFSSNDKSIEAAISTPARFQRATTLPFQKVENWVWSAVRAALLATPISLISWKSAVYCALSSAGGPPGRNCEWDCIAQVVIDATCGLEPGANAGGVGRHSPEVVPPRNGARTVVKP